jgi:beta-1,4-mannosyltransferase
MKSADSRLSDPLSILMMPDYQADNPYQVLLAKALKTQNVEVHFPKGYRRLFPIFRVIKSAPTVAVLHLHWLTPYLKGKSSLVHLIYIIKFLLDILLTRLSGVKVVWTVHNLRSHNTPFPNLESWANRGIAQLVNQVIVHHHSTLDQIIQTYWLDIAKVKVIPHGHYREGYGVPIPALEARQVLGLPLKGRIYLNLGMLRPYKGIESLLQIWQGNQHFFAKDTLVIAGKALDKTYGLHLAQQIASVESIQYFAKFIEDYDIPLFFSAADMVVLPFQDVLTSGSLILAMSYGKPVIAPCLGGIPETLGVADWLLYDPNDSEGLLKALIQSTEDDLNQLSQLVKQACDRLDWDEIGQVTADTYRSILGLSTGVVDES